MNELTWQALAAPAGTVAAVTLLLTILKAALGPLWTDTVNRIGALVLSVGIMVGVTAVIGTNNPLWAGLVLAAFNGIIVCGAVLGVTTVYKTKVKDDNIQYGAPIYWDSKKK